MTIEADGSYSYIADQTASKRLLTGETRTETFTYTVSDSKDTDTGEITFLITGINDSPVAINDSFRVEEDSSKYRSIVQGLLANDTDVDGDALSITTIRTGDETSVLNSTTLSRTATGTYGTVAINEDGSYRYTADQDAADALDEGDLVTGIFTYTLSDGESTDQGELAIEILGINDAPILTEIQTGFITAQDDSSSLITSNLTGQLNATDADESASLTYGISNTSSTSYTGSYGVLTVNKNTGSYSFTPNETAIYTINAGQQVSDTFDIYVSDGSLTSTQSFSIDITGGKYAEASLSSTESLSGSLAENGFAITSFAGSDFAKDAVESLLTDPITGTTNSFKFDNQQSILSASTDFNRLQSLQTDQANNLIVPSTSSLDGSNEFLEFVGDSINKIFSTFDGDNGIRLKLPKSSLQDLGSTEDSFSPQRRDLAGSNKTAWNKFVPANRAGMIPLLVSLNLKPERETIVQLKANTLDANGSADLTFTAENWEESQLLWIDANQLECQEENIELNLELISFPSNKPNNISVDNISIAIQKPTLCPIGNIATTQIEQEGEIENPNLDLELSSITEKQSALYLLARASLSPFLALTNMALHIIKQLEQDDSTQAALANQDDSTIVDTDHRNPAELNESYDHFFEPLHFNVTPEIAVPKPSTHNPIQTAQGGQAPLLADIFNSFEIL